MVGQWAEPSTARQGRAALIRHTSVVLTVTGEHDRLDHALGGEIADAGLQDTLHEVAKECLSFRRTAGTAVHHAGEVTAASGGTGEDLGTAIASLYRLAEPLGVTRGVGWTGSAATATAIVTTLLVQAIGYAATLSATDIFNKYGTFL